MEEIDIVWRSFVKDRKSGFTAFYEKYYKVMLAYFLSRLNHLDIAQDAVSDLFIKVYNYEELDQIRSPMNWLYTMARNYCFTYWSTKDRRTQILANVIDPKLNFTQFQADIEIDIESIEESIKTHLDELDYSIWNLNVQGYTNEEIGAKVDLKKKSVANRKLRIKDKIRKLLANELDL